MALSAPIVPVSPVADQRVSATNASIIIDFENNPNIIRINAVLAYQAGSGFLNGYSGSIITWTDGKRIILNPPSAFTRDSVIPVHCEDDSINVLDYIFIASIDQMTFTDDASNPDIIDIDGTNVFVSYDKRDPASAEIGGISINMRKHDPNTSEVEVIVGEFCGLGYNPDIGKLLAFFNINGVIYASDALPADLPVTLTNVTDLTDYAPTVPGDDSIESRDKTQYYSLKSTVADTIRTNVGSSYLKEYELNPGDYNPTPELISIDPVVIRIGPPTADPEASAIYGYLVSRLYKPTGTFSGGWQFVPWSPPYVDFVDGGRALNVTYVVIALYLYRDNQTVPDNGPPMYVELADIVFGADLVPAYLGSSYLKSESKTQFTAIKNYPTDTIRTNPGSSYLYGLTITGFGSKGIG